MEDPVVVEVSVRDQRAESEDGSGTVKAPAGAGDIETVGDQVTTGAFDRAVGDRPAGREGGVVVKPIEVAGEVAGQVVTAPRRAAGSRSAAT